MHGLPSASAASCSGANNAEPPAPGRGETPLLPLSPAPQPRPSFLWVLPVILLEFLVLGLPASVLPGLLSEALGESAISLLGVSAGVKGLLSFAASPVVGALSDTHGRRIPILVTSFGTAVPFCLLAVVPSLRVYLIVNAGCGLFLATFSLIMAYVADTTRPHERTRAFGVALAMFGVSMSGGPFAGAFLVDAAGPRALWLACCGCAGLNLAYIALVLPESCPPTAAASATAAPGDAASGADALGVAPSASPLRRPRLLLRAARAACAARAVRVLVVVALLDECAEQLLLQAYCLPPVRLVARCSPPRPAPAAHLPRPAPAWQLLLQYLTQRFGLGSWPRAALLAEVGLLSALSLTLVLWLLKRHLSDYHVLRPAPRAI
jgi:MFS family permease